MVLEIRKDLTIEYADRDKWKLSGDNFADFHSFIPSGVACIPMYAPCVPYICPGQA